MALKKHNKEKLSKAQIQKDRMLLRQFIFDLIKRPYKEVRTIMRLSTSSRYGFNIEDDSFWYNFNLTRSGLVDIIFESIIEIDKKQGSDGIWFIPLDKLCEMVEDKLCNEIKKVKFSDYKGLCAKGIPSFFRKGLYDMFISVAKRHYFTELLIENVGLEEGVREDEIYNETVVYNKPPIIINFYTLYEEKDLFFECDFDDFHDDDFKGSEIPFYICFQAVAWDESIDDFSYRDIRIEDLNINSL